MNALVKTAATLEFVDIPVPKPSSGEVIVRVMCAALCRTDVYVADGLLPATEGRVLGHECAGVIFRLGEGVAQEKLGSRVTVFPWRGCGHCSYCLDDPEKLGYLCPHRKLLGWHIDGCFAEYLCVPADRCLPLQDEISFQAGAFVEPLLAALGVLRAPLKDAPRIAVLGKSRIGKLCSVVIGEVGNFDHELLELGEGSENSCDLVVETYASSESIADALRILKPDGLLVLKSRPPDSVAFPLRLQVEKEISTMALSYGTVRMTMMLLRHKFELFEDLLSEAVPLSSWQSAFQQARLGVDTKKVFFLPHAP